jgi:hypothetical protein
LLCRPTHDCLLPGACSLPVLVREFGWTGTAQLATTLSSSSTLSLEREQLPAALSCYSSTTSDGRAEACTLSQESTTRVPTAAGELTTGDATTDGRRDERVGERLVEGLKLQGLRKGRVGYSSISHVISLSRERERAVR